MNTLDISDFFMQHDANGDIANATRKMVRYVKTTSSTKSKLEVVA